MRVRILAGVGVLVGLGAVTSAVAAPTKGAPGAKASSKTVALSSTAKASPAAQKEPPKPPPPAAAPAPKLDPFGVKMIHATKAGGRTWFAKWNAARTLAKGQTDPVDPEFQNRGDSPFVIAADGTATATGNVMRHYVWDQSRAKKWHDIELTFYAMRLPSPASKSYSGLVIEVRTDDGHVDDPARQCAGASYAMSMYYDGRAEFKKEAKHPVYSAKNPTAKIWGGGPLPESKWVGFKATVRDVGESVELVLYRDVTDGKDGGTWEKVLEFTDQSGWSVGDGSPICGHPADHVLRGAFPIVLLRNDSASMKYKKLGIREID